MDKKEVENCLICNCTPSTTYVNSHANSYSTNRAMFVFRNLLELPEQRLIKFHSCYGAEDFNEKWFNICAECDLAVGQCHLIYQQLLDIWEKFRTAKEKLIKLIKEEVSSTEQVEAVSSRSDSENEKEKARIEFLEKSRMFAKNHNYNEAKDPFLTIRRSGRRTIIEQTEMVNHEESEWQGKQELEENYNDNFDEEEVLLDTGVPIEIQVKSECNEHDDPLRESDEESQEVDAEWENGTFKTKGNEERSKYSEHYNPRVPCPYCGKLYTRYYLKSHVAVVHEKKQGHACPVCGKTFVDKHIMKKHAKNVHGKKIKFEKEKKTKLSVRDVERNQKCEKEEKDSFTEPKAKIRKIDKQIMNRVDLEKLENQQEITEEQQSSEEEFEEDNLEEVENSEDEEEVENSEDEEEVENSEDEEEVENSDNEMEVENSEDEKEVENSEDEKEVENSEDEKEVENSEDEEKMENSENEEEVESSKDGEFEEGEDEESVDEELEETTSKSKRRRRSKFQIPQLPCPHCGNSYTKYYLAVHIASVHEKVKNYVCTICGKAYCVKQNLDRHMKSRHRKNRIKGKRHECTVDGCIQKYASLKGLKEHIKAHKTKKIQMFSCKLCDKQFFYTFMLKAHVADMHPDPSKKFRCDQCSFASHRALKLTIHKQQAHSSEPTANPTCPVAGCSETFKTLKALSVHMKTHPEKVRKEAIGQPTEFPCLQCGKTFPALHVLQNHSTVHAPHLKPYICEICGASFGTRGRLDEHRQQTLRCKRLHMSEIEATVVCQICGKPSASERALAKHIRFIHEKNYSLRCQVCGKGVIGNVSLSKHLARAHNMGDFRCDHGKCTKVFWSQESLQMHISYKHKNEKGPLECNLCEKTFFRKSGLRQHVRVVHKTIKPNKE